MKIVLVHPLIPQNTGSIGRLCAANNVPLVLVEPLGFSVEDKWVRRAGLDYWPWIDLSVVSNFETVLSQGGRPWFFSSHAKRSFTEVSYREGDLLVFGSETTGLPDEIVAPFPDNAVALPMPNPNVRSLNLAQTAAVALYEARRQLGLTEFENHRKGVE